MKKQTVVERQIAAVFGEKTPERISQEDALGF